MLTRLAVIHVSLCSRCSSLVSQVWERKCILEWSKAEIDAWLEKKGWAEHIVALKVSDGEVLASRKFQRLAKAVGEDDAEDIFTAVGLVLDRQRGMLLPDDEFIRLMAARGECSSPCLAPASARCAPTPSSSVPPAPHSQALERQVRITTSACHRTPRCSSWYTPCCPPVAR